MSDLPETYTCPSGAILELKDAPFETSMKLLKTVARELSTVATGMKIDINFANDPSALAKLLAQDLPVDLLKNALCAVIASESIETVLGECMGRSLYAGRAADRKAFESRNARQDWLPCAWEVMKFNLSPFFAGLTSKSSTVAAAIGAPPR